MTTDELDRYIDRVVSARLAQIDVCARLASVSSQTATDLALAACAAAGVTHVEGLPVEAFRQKGADEAGEVLQIVLDDLRAHHPDLADQLSETLAGYMAEDAADAVP